MCIYFSIIISAICQPNTCTHDWYRSLSHVESLLSFLTSWQPWEIDTDPKIDVISLGIKGNGLQWWRRNGIHDWRPIHWSSWDLGEIFEIEFSFFFDHFYFQIIPSDECHATWLIKSTHVHVIWYRQMERRQMYEWLIITIQTHFKITAITYSRVLSVL